MRVITLAASSTTDRDGEVRILGVLIFEGAFTLKPAYRDGVDAKFCYCIDDDFLTVVTEEQCKAIFGRCPKPGKSIVLEIRSKKVRYKNAEKS